MVKQKQVSILGLATYVTQFLVLAANLLVTERTHLVLIITATLHTSGARQHENSAPQHQQTHQSGYVTVHSTL